MIGRFLLIMMSCGALFGAPQRESLAVQEMRLSMEQVSYQLRGHQSEMDLFQERIQGLERALEQLGASKQNQSVETRLGKLERAHETLITDFKSLKTHLNETNRALATCQGKLTSIDQQLSSDIKGLKQSLHSMLALLQGEAAAGIYVVQPGDSLGQIALDHKVDVKSLKQSNQLESDRIFVGQKLTIPAK